MRKIQFITILTLGSMLSIPAFAAGNHGNEGHGQGHGDNGKQDDHKRPKFAPPRPKYEVKPANPYRNGVWTPGYYVWHPERTRYVWQTGLWVQPPREHAVYTPARWELRTDAWTLTIGHW